MASRAGVPNKNKAFLLKRLQDMYGDDFHPIMKMAENAVTMQDKLDIDPDAPVTDRKAVIDAWDKIAQYTEPKLKAIEVSGSMEISDLDDKELDARLSELIQKGKG